MFLEYRCPNVIGKGGKKYQCRAELGGPSVKSLLAYDFSRGAFKDVRFCPKCHCFFEITLNTNKFFPVYRVIKKGDRIKFTQPIIDNRIE
jgi:hypothetical protein